MARRPDPKGETPGPASNGGFEGQPTGGGAKRSGIGGAAQAKVCTGCEKPFTAARKLRGVSTMLFQHFASGRVGTHPAYLCGKCLAFVKTPGNRPYDLPGAARAVQYLEQLVSAEPTGLVQ